jgi:hypothetical protein
MLCRELKNQKSSMAATKLQEARAEADQYKAELVRLRAMLQTSLSGKEASSQANHKDQSEAIQRLQADNASLTQTICEL